MESDGLPLRDLDFTDIYVCLSDPDVSSSYTPRPRSGARMRSVLVPPEFRQAVNSLVQVIKSQHDGDFSMDHDDMRLRGVHLNVFGDQRWVCLRRFPTEVPELDALSFAPDVLKAFQSWGRRSGLIVIGGSTRAGKTTTATALLRHYLREHGQVAITIEDPIEYDLQGRHGEEGFCLQIPVYKDDQWADRLKDALRSAPRYILLGEVRTTQAARNLLRAANSGHLVITTVHGGRVEETLSAIVQMAQAELQDMAMSLLADGLLAVVHQRIEGGRPVNEILSTRDDNSDLIRAMIRAGKLQTLSSEIARQRINRSRTADEEGSAPPRAAASSTRSAAAPTTVAQPARKGWFRR